MKADKVKQGIQYLCKQQIHTENIFLCIFLLLGVYCMIAIPPFRISDEYRHFVRAYEVAEGGFISDGYVTKNIDLGISGKQAVWEGWRKLESRRISDNVPQTVVEITSYSPFTYVVSSLGIFLVKWFTNDILVIMYFARMSQFLLCAFLLYMAVKYIPVGQNLVMLIALLPISIQEMVSLSGDAMAIAIAIDVVAFVLYQRSKTEGVMKPVEIVSIFLMAFFLGQNKHVYVFLSFLFILIPSYRFGGMKKKCIWGGCAAGLTMVTMLFMLTRLGVHLSLSNDVGQVQEAIGQQLEFKGYSIWQVIFRTFRYRYRLYLATSTGFGFGDLDIHPDIYYSYILLLLLFYVGILEEKKGRLLSVAFRISALAVSALSVIALFYVFKEWVIAETGISNGMQGRYFTPLFLPTMLAVSIPNKRIRFPIIKREFFFPLILSLDLCVLTSVLGMCLKYSS